MGEQKPEAIKFMSIADQDNEMSFEEMKEHVIERAREVVDELLPHTRELAEITRKQHLSLFKKMTSGDNWLFFNQALKNKENFLEQFRQQHKPGKGMFYRYRAALRHGLVLKLKDFLQDEKKQSSKQWMQDALGMLIQLEYIQPDPYRNRIQQYRSGKIQTEKNISFKKSKGFNSKKRMLKELPTGWQDKIIEALPPDDRLPCHILKLTGCRGIELTYGVNIFLDDKKDRVGIEIIGAKTGEHSGHAKRIIYFSKEILDYLPDLGWRFPEKPKRVSVKNLKSFSERIETAGFKCGYNVYTQTGKKNRVTTSTFRHQVSADLKSAGYAPDEIALVMGHAVTKTQQYYGSKKSGRGRRFLPIAAAGTREIKDTSHPWPEKSDGPAKVQRG